MAGRTDGSHQCVELSGLSRVPCCRARAALMLTPPLLFWDSERPRSNPAAVPAR